MELHNNGSLSARSGEQAAVHAATAVSDNTMLVIAVAVPLAIVLACAGGLRYRRQTRATAPKRLVEVSGLTVEQATFPRSSMVDDGRSVEMTSTAR